MHMHLHKHIRRFQEPKKLCWGGPAATWGRRNGHVEDATTTKGSVCTWGVRLPALIRMESWGESRDRIYLYIIDTCLSMYVCMYVCMYAWMCIYIYVIPMLFIYIYKHICIYGNLCTTNLSGLLKRDIVMGIYNPMDSAVTSKEVVGVWFGGQYLFRTIW